MISETELQTRQYWDKLWGRFLRHQGMIAPSGKLVQLLLPVVPRGRLVLDLGCGEGRNTLYLGRIGYRAIGLDLSAKAIRLLKNNLFEEEVKGWGLIGDARQIPFPDGSFDGILAHNLFDHLDQAGFGTALAESLRILKPEGHLLMTLDPPPEGLSSRVAVTRDDGTIVFVSGPRKGMIFRSWSEAELQPCLERGWQKVKDELTPRKGRILLLKKLSQDS